MKIQTVLLSIIVLSILQSAHASIEVTKTAADSFWPEESYHGFMKVDRPDGDIFYWLFPSRNNMATDPWILWLTGGPGCGSEIAIFTENGPFFIKNDKLEKNMHSWNNNANMIYIDSPLGSGLSSPRKFFLN